MKNIFLILILLLLATKTFANDISTAAKLWTKINIKYGNKMWGPPRKLQILRKDSSMRETTWGSNSFIKKINPELINNLLLELKNPINYKEDPLSMFQKDSIWLKENAKVLWENFRKDNIYPKRIDIDSFAINVIKNYSLVKNQISKLQDGSGNSDDYPYVSFEFITAQDTFNLFTEGKYPFMLPWQTTQKFYNSQISLIVAEILPNNSHHANKTKLRLCGKRFEYYLMSFIYFKHISSYKDFITAQTKYPILFKYLEKQFRIKKSRVGLWSIFNWDRSIFPPSCLELHLEDKSISPNIQFYLVIGEKASIKSLNSFLKKKSDIIEFLSKNPVYQYTLNNDSCLGEIYFSQTKSLSKDSKISFMEDAIEKKLDKKHYAGKLDNAILFELNEKDKKFSRWIFLEDGTMILWHKKGKSSIKQLENITQKQWTICKVIPPSLIK